jgi:hypothetical protein
MVIGLSKGDPQQSDFAQTLERTEEVQYLKRGSYSSLISVL